MTVARCPVCGRTFELELSTSPPFCGDRCRKIDLNRWLGEQYALPANEPEDEPSVDPPADE